MSAVWKESRRWVYDYLIRHPDASVDEIAREGARCDIALHKGLISDAKRDLKKFQTVVGNLDSVIPQRPDSVPMVSCDRCGGEHWISQCNAIPPPEEEPPPLPLTEVTPMTTIEPPQILETLENTKPAPPRSPAGDVGRRFGADGTARRRGRLNEMLELDPGAEPLALQQLLWGEFGIALDVAYIYATCRVSREIHGLPPLREVEAYTKAFSTRTMAPREPAATETSGVDPALQEEVLTVDAELAYLAQQMREVIRAHGLDDLSLRTENGAIHWEYAVRRSGMGRLALE